MTTTTNLSKFGYRELTMLKDLLTVMLKEGLPNGFENNELTVMMNTSSGTVFFTNSEYQSCLLIDNKLRLWHNLPYSGKEGIIEDLYHLTIEEEDLNYIKEWAKIENIQLTSKLI